MHRSRLSTILIDCSDSEYERGAAFWSEALGKPRMQADNPRYESLKGRIGGKRGALRRSPARRL